MSIYIDTYLNLQVSQPTTITAGLTLHSPIVPLLNCHHHHYRILLCIKILPQNDRCIHTAFTTFTTTATRLLTPV